MVYPFDSHQRDPEMTIAKVFWSGRSQAVRLPKDFRFEGDAVRIRRRGQSVILEPIVDNWTWLEAVVGPLDDEFVRFVSEEPAAQDRPRLEDF